MTIEIQPKLFGLIPLRRKQELKPGGTIGNRFGGFQWSMRREYYALDKDNLIDRSEESGLVVDPEDGALRSPDAESSKQRILSMNDINKADIGIPLPFIPGIVRIVTWRPTGTKEVKTKQRQPQR
jgi:hypothetical protein